MIRSCGQADNGGSSMAVVKQGGRWRRGLIDRCEEAVAEQVTLHAGWDMRYRSSFKYQCDVLWKESPAYATVLQRLQLAF